MTELNRLIMQGDVLEQLDRMDEESIDCVITSPPYWGLRDYGVEGQWGLEEDFHKYLEHMQAFMDKIKRVLKNTGTVWINLGDTYGTNTGSIYGQSGLHGMGCDCHSCDSSKKQDNHFQGLVPYKKQSVPVKSRIGMPERFYIACIDNGWIARNHIPWYKSNSMPSSVKDRFTNKWESIFFFAKQQKYYFNLDAVREKTLTETKPFNIRVRENKTGHAQSKLGDRSWTASDEELTTHNEKGERKHSGMQTIADKHYGNYDKDGNNLNNPNGKNPGDVFFINPKPFPEAHFATFPVDLPLKILKCACPEQICKKCGKNREPVSKTTFNPIRKPYNNGVYELEAKGDRRVATVNRKGVGYNTHEIIGYTDCGCNAGFEAGIVLDPFFGAGTVGIAAEKLGRRWIGIELKQEYIDIAKKRLELYMNERLIA